MVRVTTVDVSLVLSSPSQVLPGLFDQVGHQTLGSPRPCSNGSGCQEWLRVLE